MMYHQQMTFPWRCCSMSPNADSIAGLIHLLLSVETQVFFFS